MSSRQVHPIRTTETMPIISSAELKQNAEFLVQTADLLLDFDKNHTKSDYDAVAMVKSMAELMEKSLDLFLKNDPDPLDDRHPHRTHPDSVFGNVLKVIFKNDDFMTKLVVSYILGRDNVELNIQGCRFLLDCVPGLDSKVVFSDPDDFIPRLYQWALDGTNETLEGYGMGLLAAAHENPENASKYRNENAQLVTHALNRLKELQARQQQEESESESQKTIGQTDFSQLNGSHQENRPKGDKILENNSEDVRNQASSSQPPPPKKRRTEPCLSTMLLAETAPRVPSYQNLRNLDDSNSKWDILQPFIFGTQQVYPLSLATYQRYILQYLAACGEYQDLLLQTFEGNALQILLDYIDLEKSKDIRLTFDALKYLTSLLVHRKFALEFVERDGIQALLRLPRNSLASVGVVTALYYIAYNSDVMETLCQMNSEIIDDVVQYVLWCLEHSYESGKASACMFFSQALFYKALLKRFDQFDGPRKLYNYLATLTLMQNHDEHVEMTEEQVHTSTQCVKSSVATFRCYLVAHVFSRVEAHKKTYGNVLPIGLRFPDLIQGDSPDFKSMKHYEEVSWECETILLEMLRFTDGSFREAENLRKMGMVRLFLAVRSVSRDWVGVSTTFRNEMLVNALDALSIMLCLPSIQLELLTVHRYNLQDSEGFRVLIKTAAGKHDEDAAQRMSALGCIQRCVFMEPECWKALEYGMKSANEPTSSANSSARKYSKKLTPSIMSHLEKMWTEVRKVDGVYIIIDLINCKTPITEADSIRKLAVKVLTGLARHPEVRQLLSKLPLIAQSGLQILMREPVCSDKRDIHAGFCKEAMNLLQVVTGKKIYDQTAKDIPHVKGLAEKMHRQWVIENTRVAYNETELLQLIHDHLQKKGLNSVAAMLKTEAKLPDRPASRTSVTPVRTRPFPSTGKNFTKIEDRNPTLAPRYLQSEIGGISNRRPSNAGTFSSPAPSRSLSTDDDVFATPTLPKKYSGNFPKKLLISPARTKFRPTSNGENSAVIRPFRDLDNIITDHFRTQHSTCKNPVTTCPPFSLYYPHTCPERLLKQPIVQNISYRLINYDLMKPHQRVTSQLRNERTIFSRFRNIKTMLEHDESYTKAVFSVDDEHLIVGMFSGELHWINVETGSDDSHTNCHNSALTHIEPSKDGSMVLTSSAYVRPLSALWRLGERMERMHIYRSDSIVKFANTSVQRIVGTCGEQASVYDTETNIVVDTYRTPEHCGHHYKKNTASFSPDDRLIFNDGLLWDIRNRNNFIHRFDRLNKNALFGTFHPHGTQLIIDQEVYDIRTLRVVHHVPELANQQISFNSTGNIMYVSECAELTREEDFPESTVSSFRTFDTSDYSALTTFEGKRPVLDLCTSHRDQTMCLIEQLRPQMNDYMVQASTHLRMVEIGRLKDTEDENEEEEDDLRQENSSAYGSDGSDSDNDEDDDENEDNDEDDDDVDDMLRERGSVFEALGRLGDDSSDDSDSNLSDVDFEEMLNQMIHQARQRRNNPSNGGGGGGARRPLFAVNIDENGAEPPALPDESNDSDGAIEEEEDEGDNDAEEDPDFDMDAAIDDLVDRVDDEVDEDEMDAFSESEGSWRTASQIGSEDINLDDLDEEAAAAAQNEDHPAENRRRGADEESRDAQRLRGLARDFRNFGDRIRQSGPTSDILNARVEEQRANFMEALGREGQQQNARQADPEPENFEEEEEEIMSVSSVALNPALRRKQRRENQ